jgi:mRNA interferase HigB
MKIPSSMRIIAKRTIVEFYKDKPEHADAKAQLEAWYSDVRSARWKNPADVKALYRSASILKSNRVVFNICGNKYRLVVKVNYPAQIVFIRFIGTHKQYDSINAEEI